MNAGRSDRSTIEEFVARNGLSATFADCAERHYLGLARWLLKRKAPTAPLVVGLNGAQGSGKTTLAKFLQYVLRTTAGLNVIVLSLDDFYLPRADRARLAASVHPLLATRGVPGTHDTGLLADCFTTLKRLGQDQTLRLPRFDKATDDRAPSDKWGSARGPVDIILFEGWCVGTPPESNEELAAPVNVLERSKDSDGQWRQYVNDRLKDDYARLFEHIEVLLFLKIPGFDAIHRWRGEQEDALRATLDPPAAARTMTDDELTVFIQHFERLTRVALCKLPERADVLIELNENHACEACRYRQPKS